MDRSAAWRDRIAASLRHVGDAPCQMDLAMTRMRGDRAKMPFSRRQGIFACRREKGIKEGSLIQMVRLLVGICRGA